MCSLLIGCAEQEIRSQSARDFAAGNALQAIAELDAGVRAHPESAALRLDLLRTRELATEQAVGEAKQFRTEGKLEDAQTRLQQALAINPANERIVAQIEELATERAQLAALAEARDLAARGLTESALHRIGEALHNNPRHAGLVELQRQLETAQREQLLKSEGAMLGETRPISLDFRDANLRTVLDMVSRTSGINFIFDRDVHGEARVSVYLRGARVQDALDLITSTNALSMKVIDPKTVMIYPNTPDKQREYQEQVVRVFYLSNADAKGAASFLRAMLKLHEPFVDERTNMVALRDNQENIQLAERLIAMYDSAEPEVVLEMEVLEISSTSLTNLGIQFPTSVSLTPIAPSASGLTLGNIRSLTKDNIALGIGGLTVNLQRQVGDFSTLANPQIRVKNKEKAKVLVGDKIPIVTSTTGTGGFVSDSVSYIDVGLKLDVQPTIYPDDQVSIQVGLEVSSLGSSITTSSGTVAYQIGTRDASTVLRLRDGETQLLAGLISKDESTNSNRLPILGDIPLLGRLFSSNLDNGARKELVLAITPHIVRNLRQPSASESEIWVGTEAAPKLRPPGGLRASPASDAGVSAHGADPTAPAGNAAAGATTDATHGQAEPAAAAKLSWEGPHDVGVGDMFDLHLTLETPGALRGLPLEIHYDSAHLQFADATVGDLFGQGGAQVSLSKNDDGAGIARVGVLRNQATGASGKGVAVNVRFKAKASGDAKIELTAAKAIGLEGPLPTPALPPAWGVHVK